VKGKWWITASIFIFIGLYFLYFRWSSAIRQPLEFSHRQHVLQKIPCSTCHKTVETLPEVSACVSCHPKLQIVSGTAWQKVYRITPDIIFSHQNHTDFPCSSCHKAMTSAYRWVHETRFSMAFCMDCHAQKGAKNECKTCHTNR
jgi:hypothetical protein